MNFATVRLGKTSVDAIKSINALKAGLVQSSLDINVTCTQVPAEFVPGTAIFLWLGSDNNKGMPTSWKQGFKAYGTLKQIDRGDNYNDNSTFVISINYVFDDAVSRLDFLRETPQAYYWFSAMPIIGLDDHSNQTVRMIQSDYERNDVRAFFYALSIIVSNFRESISSFDNNLSILFENYILPNPRTTQKSLRKSSQGSQGQLQIIYYGAPGTGKSHTTDKLVEGDKNNRYHQRTTFHPDSDYSSFVGCYKPTKEKDELTYKFVPQAFLKAYVAAWRNISEPYYLIIEEINRGNCAQIFGDIFQLLDRRSDGFSKYHISTDSDIAAFLRDEAFAGFSADELPHIEGIDCKYSLKSGPVAH